MNIRLLACVLLLAVGVAGTLGADRCDAQFATGLYLGQTPPGTTPEVFAPGIISKDTRYEYSIAFTPDLTECAFGITNNFWNTFNIRTTVMAPDSTWSNPDRAPFLGPFGTGDGLSPAYSINGQKVYFASSRPAYPPANIWESERDSLGSWTLPVMVPAPISTADNEFAPCLTNSDALYFVSYRPGGLGTGDVYRSVPVGGVYTTVENLGAPISSPDLDSTPFVAPDESYMLFESDRPGGFGQHDIYISYQWHGVWSAPVNAGPDINTDEIEDEPYVSPDGKYFFFNRREAFQTQTQTDIHWVDIAAVVDPTFAKEHLRGVARGSTLRQNAPNPFHPSTEITYSLSAPGFVTIRIFDVAGRQVETLVNRSQIAGAHTVMLTASRTRALASGQYFYRLFVDGNAVSTRKMLLVK